MHKCTLTHKKWLASWLISCLLVTAYAFADTTNTIFFYNPETNVDNYLSLKKEFDYYFSTKGSLYFQPIEIKETFEKVVLKNKSAIYLMSSSHYAELKKKVALKPIFVGRYQGKSTYKKILTSKKSIKNFTNLKGKRIASSGNENLTRRLLKNLFTEQPNSWLKSLKILTVPKDVDALMSVGYGLAYAAITTERSLETLSKINPKQSKRLKVLATSEEIPMLILVIPQDSKPMLSPALDIIKNMEHNRDGRIMLKRIGIDSWHLFDDIKHIFKPNLYGT